MALKIFDGYQSKFVGDTEDNFGDLVALISKEAKAPIESHAREGAAEHLLEIIGKHGQPYLYNNQQRLGIRANRPGTSTHERHNDGIAYRLPVGAKLKVWQRGIDVQRDRVSAFISAAAKHGLIATQTYPASAVEAQHVNFRKEPKISYLLWRIRPLREGSTGARVKWLTGALSTLKDHDTGDPYLDHRTRTVTDSVAKAIKSFQYDHHLKTDGIVGYKTRILIGGMLKNHKKKG